MFRVLSVNKEKEVKRLDFVFCIQANCLHGPALSMKNYWIINIQYLPRKEKKKNSNA